MRSATRARRPPSRRISAARDPAAIEASSPSWALTPAGTPCAPSASEVMKKPPLTPTSDPSSAATAEVFSRWATLPSWVAVTVPRNARGSMTATLTFSTSAGWSAS
ncbi:hypothetical protein [Sphaerisporangium krabiense]|uniref:Uncharacterized protein n=1 Tax=Sphaerisporangium krabiense TaxID=763782 RepID=A0A7W9DPJ4_9ACTN|nr:hypothetical protein [Sphaerisporangium krabiense]MBB5626496.1 hypothetical protein [Sphaerisporangium krabiense]